LTLFGLLTLFGCAPLVPSPPTAPFSQQQAARLISELSTQQSSIVSFHGVGKLRFKDPKGTSEANLLAVGSRPFRIRVEISHPWGKPLFFVVADGDNTSVLSLVEHKFFRGRSSELPIQRLFLLRLDLSSLWQILAGKAPVLPHWRALSSKPYEIALLDSTGAVTEVISFYPRSLLPRSVRFPEHGIAVMFSDFREGEWGRNPGRIEIAIYDGNQNVEIRYDRLTFNKPIPDEVFRLEAPPDFEVIELSYRGE
jgi:outer membrane lipoprotein-sorting protein